MDVLVHTLSIGELEFEMKFTPGESEDNMLWIVAKDARCKVLGDEDIRRGVEEMVRDGVLRDGGVAEEEVLNNGVKAHLAASVLKGEVKIAGKGVASDIKMAAGGVVVGSLFRGIKKGVEVIVKSAVEEGVRGDEDLLGDTPVKKREEEESEFGRLFDGVGEKMAQQQQEQQQQQHQQQIMGEPTQNENNFGKLFDSVGETVTSSPPPPMQHTPAAQPDPAANKFAAMFEERGVGKQSLEPQPTNQPTGVGMLGGFFGALGLENLSHAVAPPPPSHAQQNQLSLPSSSESPNQISNHTTQPPPTPIEPKFVPPIVPVSNVPSESQPPPPTITSNQEPTLSPNSLHDYTESEVKRISLGYDSDGDLGGDYGKDNPPTGKRFGGYGKGFTSICWEDE
ncbi:hypothetical protein TrLO_g7466 [Triparma laevis f. longispina]|uniref:Uncharacterized protein n=1 Tax=Triparma laevis f. longispina TaxID=1714387 RepID=A0A9W7DRK9_9STRA|nr:hypothetical protein TrLO_g7466 [Triparma laevis f. longispina]